MSWTELVTLLLMDAWRTMTGRNRQDPDVGDLFDEEAEEDGDEGIDANEPRNRR